MAKPDTFSNESKREAKISHFRNFYTTHLANVQNRSAAHSDLKLAISNKEKFPGNDVFSRILPTYIEKEIEIQNILKKHFSPSLLELYKKKVEFKPNRKRLLRSNSDQSAIAAFFSAVGDGLIEESEKNKAQATYELQILKYASSCLSWYGLHPNISQREEIKYKKFNLLIKHKTHSSKVIEDFLECLSGHDFEKKFVQYYKKRKSILINGKLIPHSKIVEVKITTTFLIEGEIKLFLLSKNIRGATIEENKRNFVLACMEETDRYLPHPDDESIDTQETEHRKTKISLIDFPDALKLFNDSLSKCSDEKLDRNCMDDLRLCLETFLKGKLKNKKSLENQTRDLGKFLKQKGGNNNVTDLFHKVISFYAHYQNENVKHNSNVKKGDVQLILNLTSALIQHLANL